MLVMIPVLDRLSHGRHTLLAALPQHSLQITVSTPRVCIPLSRSVPSAAHYEPHGHASAFVINAISLPPSLAFQGEFVSHSALCHQTGISNFLSEVQPADFLFPHVQMMANHHLFDFWIGPQPPHASLILI